MTRTKLQRIDHVRWRVPREGAMNVEGRIYADDTLIRTIENDPCVAQVANVACLPGIVGAALAMPDIHWGYGFPIGGVAAFDPKLGGVVSPGGVGYDINCGVRLHTLPGIEREQLDRARDKVANALQREVPTGVGVGRRDPRVSDLDAILSNGARALVEHGIVLEDDLDAIEESGTLTGANPDRVSKRARERGTPQIGSLGSGNHFLEIDHVAEIYDPELAERFGLRVGGLTLLVHSGSRGLGHAVCEEMLTLMLKASAKAGIQLPDKQLACAPLGSPEADHYLGVMAAAANFAFCNRALIADRAMRAIADALDIKLRSMDASLLYDVCHNIAKWETHLVDGESRRLCVHRKGATRSLGPGAADLGARFQDTGQPVIIPGDMGRYSYVMCGQSGAMTESFGSACHGAGRLLARNATKKVATGHAVLKAMNDKGITLRAASVNAVVEEMPDAYKDVADVVGVVEQAGFARRVARLEPLIVVKG